MNQLIVPRSAGTADRVEFLNHAAGRVYGDSPLRPDEIVSLSCVS